MQHLTWTPMSAASTHGPDALWHFDEEEPWSLRDALLETAAQAARLPPSVWLRHADRITWGQGVRALLTLLGRGIGAGMRAIFSDEFLLIVLILVFLGVVLWLW